MTRLIAVLAIAFVIGQLFQSSVSFAALGVLLTCLGVGFILGRATNRELDR